MVNNIALTRRAALGALPAAAVLVAAPSAAAVPETPIAILYRQWREVADRPGSTDPEESEEESRRWFAQYRELQDAIVNEKPLTAGDVARQFVVENAFAEAATMIEMRGKVTV